LPLEEVLVKAREEVEAFFEEYQFHKLAKEEFPTTELDSAWKGSIKCEGKDVTIIVAIPSEFPDVLPKIYLTADFSYYPIPHIDSNRFVCTYDSNAVDFFSENVAGILRETIEKARQIISDGISGRNREDFETEFLAYWALDSSPVLIYSIIEPRDKIAEIQLATLSKSINQIKYILGNTQDQIKDYVRNLSSSSPIESFRDSLYLPLPVVPTPPFPKNNKEIFAFLRSIDQSLEKAIFDFIQKRNYQGFIFFSAPLKDSYILAGWQHLAPHMKRLTKGFRAGKIDPRLLKQRLSPEKINRLKVERIDSDRLQKRIGSDNRVLKDKTVCIIGCGSLGGQLGFSLAKSGIEQFCLIDNEELKPENVARHVCGMSEVNLDKVTGVTKKIKGHFPHVRIQTCKKRIHQVFRDNPEIIYDTDLVISTLGNTAVERRLNQIHITSSGFPSLLYSWIEPYGIASHAVLIIGGRGGCFECCLDQRKLKYNYSVGIFEGFDSTIREAGCQTSFSPYSALDADQASSIAARLALACLNGQISQSTSYTWLGDLSILGEIGISLNPLYKGKDSFSLQKFEIHKRKDCQYCS